MKNKLYLPYFIEKPNELFDLILNNVKWDNSMKARKTASFGKSYNYSQIEYPEIEMLPELKIIINDLIPFIGFEANNCLINLYENGDSTMGWHSDDISILSDNTGIAIISLGETREIKFREIDNKDKKTSYFLENGSLFYMNQDIQNKYQHSIPKSNTLNARISLTFRKIK
jgi:alkylated DNA repair dioxygenase AlkB